MLGNVPFDVAIYKVGDKYVGARSNEFGYANYELISVTPPATPDAGVGGL